MARQVEEVTIVGVAGRDGEDAMREFVERHGLGHVAHVADTDGAVWQRFGITGQPAWVFVDGETGEAETVLGALGEDGLRARVEELAGGP